MGKKCEEGAAERSRDGLSLILLSCSPMCSSGYRMGKGDSNEKMDLSMGRCQGKGIVLN